MDITFRLSFYQYDIAKTGNFPTGSGVYLLLDKDGKVIYVGESKALRKRLRNHLCGDGRSKYFYQQIAKVYIAELSVGKYQRQVVEGLLVTQYNPPYNIGDNERGRNNGII